MNFREFLADRDTSDEYTIARYLEFKAHTEGVSIEEAARRSMGRLFGQISNGDQTYVILTAFRGDVPDTPGMPALTVNRNANKQLANDLRSLKWGFTPVLGGFIETDSDEQGQVTRRPVHEESFFVGAYGGPEAVQQAVLGLIRKYKQDAALIKLPGNDEAFLIFQNGSTQPVGKWQADPQLMAQFYTRMRKGPANRQFKFEAAGNDSGMTRMAVDAYFRNKKK